MPNQNERSTTHASFTIERTYQATPARVFAAWSQPEAKARWFVGPQGWTAIERSLQVRVGGREVLKGILADGPVTLFEAVYHDVIPDQRLIYTYAMTMDDRRISVSLATVEFAPIAGGTRLRFTEQAAFLDGFQDEGGRERGTAAHLDRLAGILTAQ
jgi:uncharacterized protein YndB with AHSA1/START domain